MTDYQGPFTLVQAPLDIEFFYEGQEVLVYSMPGRWYQGNVVSVGRTRIRVAFVRVNGRECARYVNVTKLESVYPQKAGYAYQGGQYRRGWARMPRPSTEKIEALAVKVRERELWLYRQPPLQQLADCAE